MRRGRKYTNLCIPCVTQFGFEAQGSFSESMRTDQSSSNSMTAWLFSWFHSGPHPVQHHCWNWNWIMNHREKENRPDRPIMHIYKHLILSLPMPSLSSLFPATFFLLTLFQNIYRKRWTYPYHWKHVFLPLIAVRLTFFFWWTQNFFQSVSASHLKMQKVMYWSLKESGQALDSLPVTYFV